MIAKKPKFVAYCRVSTKAQGESGLGLAAQQAACQAFVASRGGVILAAIGEQHDAAGNKIEAREYVEVESGKNDKRKKLAAALAHCRKTGATLLVAKLDRASRNARLLMEIRDSGVPIVAADMPEMNTLMFMVMAGMAQQEREYISARTKAGLEQAKERGTRLGGHRDRAADIRKYRAEGIEACRAKALKAAEMIREDVEPLVRSGLSLRAIAASLTEAGILTPQKRAWSAQGVANVIDRLGIDRAA